jgi:hypothetical protein
MLVYVCRTHGAFTHAHTHTHTYTHTDTDTHTHPRIHAYVRAQRQAHTLQNGSVQQHQHRANTYGWFVRSLDKVHGAAVNIVRASLCIHTHTSTIPPPPPLYPTVRAVLTEWTSSFHSLSFLPLSQSRMRAVLIERAPSPRVHDRNTDEGK